MYNNLKIVAIVDSYSTLEPIYVVCKWKFIVGPLQVGNSYLEVVVSLLTLKKYFFMLIKILLSKKE